MSTCNYRLVKTDGYSGKYTRENGAVVDVSIPWHGYFESLNAINIDEVRL